jgi:hypothetical protein
MKQQLRKISSELKKASKLHAGQATKIDSMLKMRNAPLKAFASPMKGKLQPCQKAAAKKKFDVYPSAYANMWASNHKC